MDEIICDICKRRPAIARVTLIRNGDREVLNVCRVDLEQFERRSRASPIERMFENTGFDDIFSEPATDFDNFSSRIGYPLPRRREAVDISQYLSAHSKEVIEDAAKAAVTKFKRREVDTEHLLYALADSDITKEIFKQFKIDPQEVKNYLEKNAPHGDKKSIDEESDTLSISPRLKNVLQIAFRVSQELGHGYIGPEHLLIGLLEEEEGIASELMRQYGLTPESLRQQIVRVVGRGAAEGRVETQSTTPHLDKYSRDLSVLAKEGNLDPVIGRGDEIETTIEILSRRTKNNPVLLGEPGVGKTAIVEGLAQRILSEEVPEVLRGKRVVELNLSSLIAGTKYRGEFEERITEVVNEIVAHKDEIILFIDEFHTIMRAGGMGEEGGLDVSNIIKPYLARGDLHLIGATTLSEYQKHIERDAAFARRLQPVFVAEPTVPQTIEILRGLRDRYETHHKVKITDEAIVAAAELSDRYITGRFLPDKAIDLLDQAASRVRIGLTSQPENVRALNDQMARLNREREYATSHKKFDDAKRQEAQIKKLTEERERAERSWKETQKVTTSEVTREHIAEVVSRLTGIPITDLTSEERQKLLSMEEKLRERLVGQEEAVRAVADAIRRSRAGLTETGRPIATFLFMGPTGVGKTELAKSLAWFVFGDEDAVVRIDMSEYRERHTVSRLIGAPPGYVGYQEGGQLTETVRRRPYSILLLDEIEKAHPEVHNILLQLFDEGRLTDGKGRVVDFTHTIIIATSNLGSKIIQEQMASGKSYDDLKSELMQVLRLHFRPEFLNRIDEVIVFKALTQDEIRLIVALQLERVRRTARGQGIELHFTNALVDWIAETSFDPQFGAREIKRRIQVEIETPLAREILTGSIAEGMAVQADVDPESKKVTFVRVAEKITPSKKSSKSASSRPKQKASKS